LPRGACTPFRPRSCRRARSRDDDLPRARTSRFPRETRDVSDRLLPSTTFLTCTRALGFRPAWSALASGAIEGSVVSRRAGPASTGRVATRRFVSPSRRVAGVFSNTRTPDAVSLPDTTSSLTPRHPRSHASAIRRSACVVLRGSRPLPPPPVKRAACHDPRRLPPVLRPSSLGAAPRARLATRPG